VSGPRTYLGPVLIQVTWIFEQHLNLQFASAANALWGLLTGPRPSGAQRELSANRPQFVQLGAPPAGSAAGRARPNCVEAMAMEAGPVAEILVGPTQTC